jgi:putative DNA-invertase from lambdoid prophage Rac
MATILYARVSTNKQTIEHQRTQAEQAGFRRPQGRRLFDLLRSGDALVCDALREFTRRGVVIRTVINGITRSTARPRMLCNVPSVTRSSPSWRQLQRHKRKQPRKLSALASRTRKPIAMCEPARDASPATVPSSSRMRRRCWGNLEALARSPELQGLLARPSTASRMIRLRLRLDPELFGSQRPLLPLVYLVYICNQGILFNQWKAKQMSGSREGAP